MLQYQQLGLKQITSLNCLKMVYEMLKYYSELLVRSKISESHAPLLPHVGGSDSAPIQHPRTACLPAKHLVGRYRRNH